MSKTRTAGAQKKARQQRKARRAVIIGSEAVKNFCSLHGRCARRPEGGSHDPESSTGAPLRGRAAHVTEVEQKEWEDGGREEKPMTISSVCHSQGSPCAPHTPLGPKA